MASIGMHIARVLLNRFLTHFLFLITVSTAISASAGVRYREQDDGRMVEEVSDDSPSGCKITEYLDGSTWQRGPCYPYAQEARLITTFIMPSSDSESFIQVDIIDKDLIVQRNPDGTNYTARGILRGGNKQIIGTVLSEKGVIFTSFKKIDGAHGMWRLKHDPKDTQPDYLLEKVRSKVADVKWFDSAFVVQRNPGGTVLTAMPTELYGHLELIGTFSNGDFTYNAEFKKVEEDGARWHLEFYRPILHFISPKVRPGYKQKTADTREPGTKRTKLKNSRE